MIKEFFEYFDLDRPTIKPNEWPFSEEFKQYHRVSATPLPLPKLLEKISLQEALQKRRSAENFSSKPLALSDLSSLLFWSAGLIHRNAIANSSEATHRKNLVRRPYPSGGGRFPIELYVVLFHGQDIESGAFHYNVVRHCLERISNASLATIAAAFTGHTELISDAPAAIFLSFIGHRMIPKYGSLGFKLGLLEGGHIGQNLYLVGTAQGLAVLATGTVDYEIVHRELGLDREEETLFYQFLVGFPETGNSVDI